MTLALLSADGRALLARLAGEQVGPGRALELARSLRGSYPPDLVAAALTQQALRIAAREKFSRAGEMLFTRAGLEQASSELTAAHAAARFPARPDGEMVADLCCGIGGNLIALGAGRRVLAVDRDPVTLAFARHNASVYAAAGGLAAVAADATEISLDRAGAVFIDPARRAGGRRMAAGRSEPPLDWCLSLADRVAAVGIKAAPGLPRELVPPGWEAEFVAVGRDLKEALLWSPALATAASRATILPAGDTLTRVPGDDGEIDVAAPGAFLMDPSPAVTRAGLVEDLGRRIGAWKIDPQIAFLSAERELRTPFARTLLVVESAPWHEKHFARRLRELGIGAADIRRRGLAGDVEQIHRRLGLRGPGRATIVITRVNGRPWGLICTNVPDPG
ncbi:MAG TPA: class I SAM-dependent methyltransferase [Streptosporangiaceae bacterium]|nr:class I SAM-dependent methyltransferase [Streptosporangiaceae bacterium]